MEQPIDLLFTLDEGYLEPMQVALTSIHTHHAKQPFRIWVIHETIREEKQTQLHAFVEKFGWQLQFLEVDGAIFEGAPTVERYPREMYFRLLAGQILPTSITKVLYLDPDILVINSLQPLWETSLEGYLLAAATHRRIIDLTTKFNQIRLDTDHDYYNSGVLLINLEKARELVSWSEIQQTIEKYNKLLMLPDQDVLNHLYGKYTLEVPEEIWNYDARLYTSYLARSLGEYNSHWIAQNTAILHFCGKPKPWDAKNDTRFTALYLDYQKLTRKFMPQFELKNRPSTI